MKLEYRKLTTSEIDDINGGVAYGVFIGVLSFAGLGALMTLGAGLYTSGFTSFR